MKLSHRIIIAPFILGIAITVPTIVLADKAPSTGDTIVSSASPMPTVGNTVSSAGGVTISVSSMTPPPSKNPPVMIPASSAVSAIPSVGSSVTSAASNPPSTGASVSSAGSNNSSNNSSVSASVSSTGSQSSAGNYYLVVNPPVVNSACLLDGSIMGYGLNNDSTQVSRLQIFLKNTRELDVDVNGIFDAKTEAAVKSFQAEYADTILAPWGVKAPSGLVYITTVKKINQLSCSAPLSLNAAELATINGYKNRVNETASTKVGLSGATNTTAISVNNNSNASTSVQSGNSTVGQNNSEVANTAAVANTSIFDRFINFIIHLFKK